MKRMMTIVLMSCCVSLAAQDLPSRVAGKFEAWQLSNPTFKTVAVFAQDKYIPGDTAFFNAWFLTEDGRFVGGRQILNMDMIDSEGRIVQHMLFRVVDGTGANQIIINPDTRAGIYVMSVYNDCMRLSDPRYVYRKQITVVKHNSIIARPVTQSSNVNESLCRVRVTPVGQDIQAMISFSNPVEQPDDLVLVVTANGQLFYTAGFKRGRRDSLLIKLPRKDLPEGLSLASVINSNGALLGSRHFYNPTSSAGQCTIRLPGDTVATRQEVVSEITLTDRSGKPLQGQFSIAVSNENFRSDDASPREISIVSELTDAFKTDERSRDRYLATQPSVVSWNRVLSAKPAEAIKPPKLITMYGEVYFANSNKLVPPGTVVNCFMRKSRFTFGAEVEADGKVEMLFLDFYGTDEMFYYADLDGKELEDVRIRWIDEKIAQAPAPSSSEAGRRDDYANFTASRNVIDRSFNFFASPTRDSISASMVPLEAEFENQGTVVNLHEYRIFPTMSETIRELIPRLAHRRAGGRDAVKVNLSEANLKVLGDPLYIIDGAVTKNTAYFLSLLPDDLISIRIIYDSEHLKRFMPVSRNGIVVVQTKKGVAGNALKEDLLPVTGLTEPIAFRKPAGTTGFDKEQRPEFRSTIAWMPMVKTDVNGKARVSFYTTDDKGTMMIKVKGIVNGQVFSESRDIFVKFDRD
jgi:hypothetical protein